MRIPGFVFVIFLFFPLIELYLLIELGTVIGALSTIAVIIGTGVAGLWLVRMQGWDNYRRAQDCLKRGELPAIEMIESALIYLGGLLLLIPGLISDAMGLLLLVPPLRRTIIRYFMRRTSGSASSKTYGSSADVYEGDFHRIDDDSSSDRHS